MHVLDLLEHGRRFVDVAVVAAASLPKAIVHVAVGLPILHPAQKRRGVPLHKQQSALRYRLFDGTEDVADIIDTLGRPD